MYSLFKMGIFQPAMLDYRSVASTEFTFNKFKKHVGDSFEIAEGEKTKMRVHAGTKKGVHV